MRMVERGADDYMYRESDGAFLNLDGRFCTGPMTTITYEMTVMS